MPKVRASSGMMGTMRVTDVLVAQEVAQQLGEGHRRRDLLAAGTLVELAEDRRPPAWPASSGGRRGGAADRPGPRGAPGGSGSPGASGPGVVVGRVLELLVGDGQLQAVAEDAQLVLVHLLGLVRDVARLDARAQRPALHGLGQDDRGRAVLLRRRVVGRVELAVVVAAAAQVLELVVGLVGHEGRQARVSAEEVLAHVGARLDRVLLPLAVEDVGHALHEHAVRVARQELVPLAAPDDLDDVPAGAAEDGLQLLDDLAVAAHRPVEALQVAVDDEDEVVEALRGRRSRASPATPARPSRRRRGRPRRGCARCP